jgi:hypothetical protein
MAIAAAGYMLFKPKTVRARSAAELLSEDDDGPIVTQTAEDPTAAAQQMRDYLVGGGNFGTRNRPSSEVAAAQRVLQVADDGIVGPNTRAAALKYNVRLPRRPGSAAPAVTTKTTVSPAAAQAGAAEPQPAQVAATPREQKGSLVATASVQLSGIESLASKERVESEIRGNIGAVGRRVSTCPGAPQLKGSPSVNAKDQGSGKWVVTIRWAGTWSSAGTRLRLARS